MFLHEHFHVFGGDGGRSLTDALTHLLATPTNNRSYPIKADLIAERPSIVVGAGCWFMYAEVTQVGWSSQMKIGIGSDHRGFDAKERIKAALRRLGHAVVDHGARDATLSNYPDAGHRVTTATARRDVNCGILLCSSGVGMSIVANKVEGVRAAVCHDELSAEMARRHVAPTCSASPPTGRQTRLFSASPQCFRQRHSMGDDT